MATVITHAHSSAGCPICAAMVAENGSTNGPRMTHMNWIILLQPIPRTGPRLQARSARLGRLHRPTAKTARVGSAGWGDSELFILPGQCCSVHGSYADPLEQNVVEIADAQKDELGPPTRLGQLTRLYLEEVTEAASGLVVGDLRNAYINRFSGDDLDGVAAFAYYPYSNSVGGDTFYVAPGEVSTNASFAEDMAG